jgi:hypothetical protein
MQNIIRYMTGKLLAGEQAGRERRKKKEETKKAYADRRS